MLLKKPNLLLETFTTVLTEKIGNEWGDTSVALTGTSWRTIILVKLEEMLVQLGTLQLNFTKSQQSVSDSDMNSSLS